MERLLHDLRFGMRLLFKSPGFTIVAALSIAFGVGANVAVFRFANALLLKPLPVEDHSRVVDVFPGAETTSYVDYLQYRGATDVQGLTKAKMAECQWLKPVLVGQFEFLEWTGENHLRHSKFIGLREDKAAKKRFEGMSAQARPSADRHARQLALGLKSTAAKIAGWPPAFQA